MAINILGLNATEATLVKNSSPIRSYRLGNQDEIKNRLNTPEINEKHKVFMKNNYNASYLKQINEKRKI